jgi:hypothetical protein
VVLHFNCYFKIQTHLGLKRYQNHTKKVCIREDTQHTSSEREVACAISEAEKNMKKLPSSSPSTELFPTVISFPSFRCIGELHVRDQRETRE